MTKDNKNLELIFSRKLIKAGRFGGAEVDFLHDLAILLSICPQDTKTFTHKTYIHQYLIIIIQLVL